MRVTVAIAWAPRQVLERELELPQGASAADAWAVCCLWPAATGDSTLQQHIPHPLFAVWGQRASAHTMLQPGQRLEVLRGLRVDPKTARRERFATQGKRTAGLFSRKK